MAMTEYEAAQINALNGIAQGLNRLAQVEMARRADEEAHAPPLPTPEDLELEALQKQHQKLSMEAEIARLQSEGDDKAKLLEEGYAFREIINMLREGVIKLSQLSPETLARIREIQEARNAST